LKNTGGENKEIFNALNVTEAIARKIWRDAVTAVEQKMVNYYISKL
jgi:hypothetical protein